MKLTKKVPTTDKNQENNHLLRMLDRGIDDMEAGRELPLEDAFSQRIVNALLPDFGDAP